MHQLITIDITSTQSVGLGQKEYAQMPRIGEVVAIKKDGEDCFYEVVMVAHSSDGNGCEIFVAHPKPAVESFRGWLTH